MEPYLQMKRPFQMRHGRTLEEVTGKGILFVPCTGRAFASVPELVQTLPGVQYMIVSNGAAIYRVEDGERIYGCTAFRRFGGSGFLELPMSEEMTFEVQIQGQSYTEQRYIDDPARFGATGFGVQYIRTTRHAVEDIQAFAQKHKAELDGMAFVSADQMLRESFWKQLEDSAQDIRITSSIPHLIEIGHIDADKGKTLGHFLQMRGIPVR